MPKSFPWTTVAVLGILVASVTVLSVVGADKDSLVITLLLNLIPGLLAAGYSERNSRDIRNGVVVQKAKEGAVQALAESGVTDVAANANQATKLSMDALAQLIQTNTNATQVNTETHLTGGKPDGGQTV